MAVTIAEWEQVIAGFADAAGPRGGALQGVRLGELLGGWDEATRSNAGKERSGWARTGAAGFGRHEPGTRPVAAA